MATANICRVCLSLTECTDFVEVDDTVQEMMDFVFPFCDSSETSKSVMCNDCTGNLQMSFDFKNMCLKNVEKAVAKENFTGSVIKQEAQFVCRLCVECFEEDFFTSLHRIEDDFFLKDMLEKCLPEMNVESNLDSLLCKNCMQALQNQFNLITAYLDTNDKINDFVSYTALSNNNDEINLFNVLEFTLDIKQEPDYNCTLNMEEKLQDSTLKEVAKFENQIKEDSFADELYDNVFIDQITSHGRQPQIDKDTPGGRYDCMHCSYKTANRNNLMSHLIKHQCNSYLRCDKCSFVTKWRTSLTQHLWLHTEESRKHQCSFCPYKSRYKKHLKRHLKRHGNRPRYQCQFCKFSTLVRYCFKIHNKTKHNVMIPDEPVQHKCNLCDFVADQKSFVTKHYNKMHKRFTCEFCSYEAKTLWHIKYHTLKHKSNEEVEIFHCANCDFQTKYKQSLVSHMKQHRRRSSPSQ